MSQLYRDEDRIKEGQDVEMITRKKVSVSADIAKMQIGNFFFGEMEKTGICLLTNATLKQFLQVKWRSSMVEELVFLPTLRLHLLACCPVQQRQTEARETLVT